MKRFIIITGILLIGLTSCQKFLQEKPRTFLTPDQFYTSPEQVQAAVNGTYANIQHPFISAFVGLPISPFLSVESLTGYCTRPFPMGSEENQFLQLTKIDPSNSYLASLWEYTYLPIENCNSVIANITKSSVLDDATKNKYLGEVYFLRAYYYFYAVRLFGDIPLKITPTTGASNPQIPRNKQESVYNQIVADLLLAEKSGLPDVDASGHVSLTAVKSLLAKVYLTMAGYPLQKGAAYYQLAYDKAKEVITGGSAHLFPTYSDWRQTANKNIGENIFMLQYDPTNLNSIMHYSMLPYPPAPALSAQSDVGGGLGPDPLFYQSFAANDQRIAEKADFYHYPGPPTPYLMIYKYWDDAAAVSGKSNENMPILRYADVELMCAEAKANIDGGSTSDATAIAAYYDVHHRAFPTSASPGSITTDQVLQERFWEFCFEYQTWFDILRTRRTMNVPSGNMINAIGYKAPQHSRAFTEGDFILPLPLIEIQNNPKLTGPPQ